MDVDAVVDALALAAKETVWPARKPQITENGGINAGSERKCEVGAASWDGLIVDEGKKADVGRARPRVRG